MKRKLVMLVFCAFVAIDCYAQKKPYFTNGSELIFAYSLASDSSGKEVLSGVRFSCWYHFDQTLNIDFSNGIGFITGIGLENVGMVTRPDVGVLIKQRAYCAGVPIGFRFGNFDKRNFLTIGASCELLLDYKEKVFIDGVKKQKHHEWLSNNTNLINPAVFLKYQKKSVYVSAKYYLMDFFKPSDIHVKDEIVVSAYPKTSQLFYISIGYSGKGKSKGNKIDAPTSPKKVNRI